VGGPIGILNMQKSFSKYHDSNGNRILNCSSKDESITQVYVNKYAHTFNGFAQNLIFLSYQN
jgi:hypothetical protein